MVNLGAGRDRLSQTQKKAFTARVGARIKAARQMKFRSVVGAHAALRRYIEISLNACHKHEAGLRLPSPDTLRAYAILYDVPAQAFLDDTTGVNGIVNASSIKVNNQTPEKFTNFPFSTPSARYIPILTADEIIWSVLKGLTMPNAPKQILPLPLQSEAGAHAFGYEIPADDLSMSGGSAPSISPGTICIVDPEATPGPGDFVLVAADDGRVLARRLQATEDHTPGHAFTLIASNPLFDPIRDAHRTWHILGRIMGLHIPL